MRRFTRLYAELEESNRTSEKLAALERYFREAPPADAVWALWLLTGHRLPRPVKTSLLRAWVAEEAGLPEWLFDESYNAVGDLSETMALLLGACESRMDGDEEERPLHQWVKEYLVPLREAPDETKREMLRATWRALDRQERLVWHKLMLGEFRVGVSRTLVLRALANVLAIPPAEMAHRAMGSWSPTVEDWHRITRGSDGKGDPTRPYPFFLAYPLEGPLLSLGSRAEWQVEWKWDGIRSQVIRRGGDVLVWSRGEELMTDRFPEIVSIGRLLPPGTVIDGEILAWRDGRPLPFAVMQQRIGRKVLGKKILAEAPVALIAYDLLEHDGEDWRERPLHERRRALEQVVARVNSPSLIISPLADAGSWESLEMLRGESRARGVEGMMLKRLDSPYRVGRVRGDWWKWKIEPFRIDAVMVYAQGGHGRRASLYTDYTFAVWRGDELVPVAKAYSGLTDAEIRRVDSWIRRNTLDRHGPVRVVKPELVFEIAFEGIQRSTRHKSGVAMRFPRIARWREDKPAQEADRIEALEKLIELYGTSHRDQVAPRTQAGTFLEDEDG